jgi:mono/diheme cytochrome c family protein
MKVLRGWFDFSLPALAVIAVSIAVVWPTFALAKHASFKDEVYPILKKHCLSCHSPGGQGYEVSGLDMSSYKGLMKGTKYGPVIVPGDAFTSNLMVLVEGRADKSLKMPHNSHRPAPTKKDRIKLREWINAGAKLNDTYKKIIHPIFNSYCVECHQPGGIGYERSGFDVRTYKSLMKGTKYGSVINVGDAFNSSLVMLIEGRTKGGLKMPYVPQKSLSKWERHLIRAWIINGAKDN